MQLKNTENHFGVVAIFLHWLMAALLIGMVGVGLYMADLPVSLFKLKLYGWHKEFGILILLLAMIRIVWHVANITPSLASLPWIERAAARTVHWVFYGFMFALPLTGWLMSSASGLSVSFFGLFVLPNLIGPNHEHRIFFNELHQWLAYGLIATFSVHVAAALKHHFINHDHILRRMF